LLKNHPTGLFAHFRYSGSFGRPLANSAAVTAGMADKPAENFARYAGYPLRVWRQRLWDLNTNVYL
jgi:hypothetical protein